MQNSQKESATYFSASFDFVPTKVPLPYDLYINSSSVPSHEKFVRISLAGQVLDERDIQGFKTKYRQLYLSERQRGLYLRALCSSRDVPDEEKATVLKSTAVQHLEKIFKRDTELTTQVLTEAIEGCKEIIENLVDVFRGYSIDQLKGLVASLSFHDFYTFDHSINVAMYSILIYTTLYPNASQQDIVQVGLGGMLHDLGKLKIPTSILNNSGSLSAEHMGEIRKHPAFGADLLTTAQVVLPPGIDGATLRRVILEHHENFDGTGYPLNLSGERIHLMARVTAVADFFDAVTTKRSYHEPLSTPDAIALMAGSSGKKLDPAIFKRFAEQAAGLTDLKSSEWAVPADYDPCQPHDVLPLVPRKGFGKIKKKAA